MRGSIPETSLIRGLSVVHMFALLTRLCRLPIFSVHSNFRHKISMPEMLEIQLTTELKEMSLTDEMTHTNNMGSVEDPHSGNEVPGSNPGEVMEVRCGLLTGKLPPFCDN